MPNGGSDICGNCNAFRRAESELPEDTPAWHNVGGRCTLRDAPVTDPYWTTCSVMSRGSERIDGPMYAVDIGVVGVDGGGGYHRYPYFDGFRPIVHPGGSIQIVDSYGEEHTFSTPAEYLEFYKNSAREP